MADQFIELTARYQGVYIFLAYVVSVVGAWTTLELLLKRTGGSGWYNVLLLVGAGIAFGSTATFGMHFVGNQAVTLHLPPPFAGSGVPLSYDVGFTILSLVVSCLSMILAFSVIGLRIDTRTVSDSMSDAQAASEKERQDPTSGQTSDGFQDFKQVDLDDPDSKMGAGLRRGSSQKRSFAPLSKPATFVPLPLHKKTTADRDEVAKDAEGGEFGTRPTNVSWAGVIKILVAGVICGGGVAAMHYVGQVSINSVPRVTNTPWLVFLSILIAMVAVSVGLFLLFVVLRPRLQHRWYKRLGVALILGLAVSLMHWVALLGTHYFIVQGQPLVVPPSSANSRHLIIALVCVVTPVCCLALLAFAVIGQQRVLRQIAARHRIELSVAIFDPQGFLLCQHADGLLPSAKIYPDVRADERKTGILQLLGLRDRLSLNASSRKLTRSDPAFVAFLQSSWSWRSKQAGSIATGSSGMAPEEHADGAESPAASASWPAFAGPASRTSAAGAVDAPRLSDVLDDVSAEAMENLRRAVMGFEMASQEIATSLVGTGHLPATGILYDSILKTGHFQVSSKAAGDSFTVTQGQMLVLTRRLRTQAERDALLARGYSFADPTAVARVMANAYAVPNDRMIGYFRDVYRYSRFGVVKRVYRGRLYGGALVVQALAGDGLHVVVDPKQHHSLPAIELATLVHRASDRQVLPPTSSSACTINSVIQAIDAFAGNSLHDIQSFRSPSPQIAQVQSLVVDILRPFLDRTLSPERMAFLERRLIFAPSLIPLTDRGGPFFGADGVAQDSYMLCLKAVVPAAIVLPEASSSLTWLPFALFKAESDCVARASGLRRHSPAAPGVIDEAERDTPDGSLSNPARVDVFPARDRKTSLTPVDADDYSIEPASSTDGKDASRPAGVPAYDPDAFIKLVKMTIQPSRPWNWELPADELRNARIGLA